MPEDVVSKSRQLASAALDRLESPSCSIESVIHAAIQVAALRQHTYKRAWFQLQLLDMTATSLSQEAIGRILATALPGESLSQELAQNLFSDYTMSREVEGRETIDATPIMELEQLVQMAALLIHEDDDPGPKIYERVERNQRILTRVKANLREYLSEVRRGIHS